MAPNYIKNMSPPHKKLVLIKAQIAYYTELYLQCGKCVSDLLQTSLILMYVKCKSLP